MQFQRRSATACPGSRESLASQQGFDRSPGPRSGNTPGERFRSESLVPDTVAPMQTASGSGVTGYLRCPYRKKTAVASALSGNRFFLFSSEVLRQQKEQVDQQ